MSCCAAIKGRGNISVYSIELHSNLSIAQNFAKHSTSQHSTGDAAEQDTASSSSESKKQNCKKEKRNNTKTAKQAKTDSENRELSKYLLG